MEPILIITNFPDKKTALALAQTLVEAHLAACVNVLGESFSIYNWQGETESSSEFPVLIKTQQQHYAHIEKIITAMHPYELPEVIVVPVSSGLPAYLQWVADATQIPNKQL